MARPVERPAVRHAGITDNATQELLGRLATAATRESAIRDITTAPDSYTPPVLYEVASALYADGRKDESVYWFYLGQLRGRSDANKRKDASGQRMIAFFNDRHGSPINRHAFKDLHRLRKVVGDVVAWDRTHQRTYDPRWITMGEEGRWRVRRVRAQEKTGGFRQLQIGAGGQAVPAGGGGFVHAGAAGGLVGRSAG
jgi:hypothetical protein